METGEKVSSDSKAKAKGFFESSEVQRCSFLSSFYGGLAYAFEKHVFDSIRRDCCFGNST